jgi:hypothetical protein
VLPPGYTLPESLIIRLTLAVNGWSGNHLGERMSFRTIVQAVGLSLALLAVSASVFGEEFSRVSIPLAVNIDGRPMHSSLYLKCEMKSYDIPFDQFAVGPLDKEQTMFVTAVQAIRHAEAAKFASVWTSPNQMQGLGTTIIAMADDSPANWMSVARSNFDFDHLKLIAQLRMGPDTMFVWDSMTKGRTLRNAFYVGMDKHNQLRLSAVSSSTPVEVLALNSFEAAQAEPAAYKPSPNVHLRYEYRIPLEGNAGAGAHPVFFEFDGSPMDFPLGDLKVKAPTPLLAFFRSADLAHQYGKDDLYVSSFTPRSAARVKEWLASMESRRKPGNQPRQGPSVLGNVKFVMDAEPIFLVFEAPDQGENWKPGNLTYSYILHEGSAYKIANFSSSTELDDFLQNPQFFDTRILKTAPIQPH